MIRVEHTLGALKKFRRTPWRFQQTVQGPDEAGKSKKFVTTVLEANNRIAEATVVIDEVVFNTAEISKLCPSVSGDLLGRDWTISAASKDEIRALIIAALYDGMDFIYVPNPKPFVFYADHHNLITLYANTKSNLNLAIQPLETAGFKMIDDWQREL